jgi:hypothetical protein
MRKLLLLLVAAAVCAVAQAAPSTDKPTEQSIDALLEAGKAERLIDNMMSVMTQSMREGMNAAFKDPERNRGADGLLQEPGRHGDAR